MDDIALQERGASMEALAVHYELGDEFYSLWLGEGMGYSSGLWGGGAESLEVAQAHKTDYFAARLGVGQESKVLDVGCAWGGPSARLASHYTAHSVLGITRSPAHENHVNGLGFENLSAELVGWADHEPSGQYDAVFVLEAMEHFAQDGLPARERRQIYSAFFDRCHGWMSPRGGLGLQVFCLENVDAEQAREDLPLVRLIRERIFPEAVPPYLADLVAAWDPSFYVESLIDATADYPRTLRVWRNNLLACLDDASRLVGPDTARIVARYLAAGEALFRLHEWSLYRIILRPRRNRRTIG